MPLWAVVQEELDPREIDHARHLAEIHREVVGSLESSLETVAHGAAAHGAQAELEAESKSGSE